MVNITADIPEPGLNSPPQTVNSRSHANAGHSRHRRSDARGSGGTQPNSSISSTLSDPDTRSRKLRSPSQKIMLSRALQQANTAVLLDNAQNFEGAKEAYADACQLLQQVMRGRTGQEDKRKLEAIRKTYTNRIVELQSLDAELQVAPEKALPDRPLSNNTLSPEPQSSDPDDDVSPVIEVAIPMMIVEDASMLAHRQTRSLHASQIPPRRQSLLPPFDGEFGVEEDEPESDDIPELTHRTTTIDSELLEPGFIPQPLSISPRRPLSPVDFDPQPAIQRDSEVFGNGDLEEIQLRRQSRDTSPETTSWLDTIDESGGSTGSSLHSRHSSIGIHRKRIRRPVRATEVELSAAMDAAVEAAYGDDFEVGDEEEDEDTVDEDHIDNTSDSEALSMSQRTFERERKTMQEADREQFVQEHRRLQQENSFRESHGPSRSGHPRAERTEEEEEAEEEERLLDEMTSGYSMADFQFGAQSKSALPSMSTSNGASGAAFAEGIHATPYQKRAPPPHPPPSAALPRPPPPSTVLPSLPPPAPTLETILQSPPILPPTRPTSFGGSPGPGVRDRRLSGQNARQLKIETNSRPSSISKKPLQHSNQIGALKEEAVAAVPSIQNPTATKTVQTQRPPVPQITQGPPLTPMTSGNSISSLQSDSPGTPALARTTTQETDEAFPPSPGRFPTKSALPQGLLRKNISSTSLKMRNISIGTTVASDGSSLTAANLVIPPTTPIMPTPTGDDFTIDGLNAGGMYLFDDHVCSPASPTSIGSPAFSPPAPLESCPESFLLRPFWLMRCLYQTIAHPRGGYISTKLFIPRDVWRVKNVKIKCVDDKVAQCDLLTAALLAVGKVDTYDADALLEEMQRLETTLDQVRTTLQKKLGSEVGVQGSSSLFRGSPATEEASTSTEALLSKAVYSSNKSYLSSWKKLRSKSSGAALTNSFNGTKDAMKDTLSMTTLPMTPTPTSRPPKRKVGQLQFTGPNSNYMGALARLCDAVQVIDQIGRQVEDPGLKHSSKTHVGLELSVRSAAEFFGFYVCRFALNDIGLMLDKFIKRGSEWVLA